MNIDTTALDALFDANPDAAKGIAAAYQLLLNGVPTQAGFTSLINNAIMTNFGAGPGPVFNAENIFINLANSLVQGNPTAAANFAALAPGATLLDQVTALYNNLVPEASRTADGLNFVTRPEALAFYQAVAAERGVAGDNGAAIVAMASMAQIFVQNDIPGLGDSVNDLIAAVNNNTSMLPADGDAFTPIETADGTGFDTDDVAPTDPTAGSTFTLTTGADAGANFTGGGLNDTFVGTDTTLTPGDSLDGAGGTDALNVSTNIADDKVLAGFSTKNIEKVTVTADGTAGKTLTFDVTGVDGATSLTNSNSSVNLTLVGGKAITDIALNDVSGGNTVVNYDAPVVAGAADTQKISLSNVNDVNDMAASGIQVNGVETFEVDVQGTEGSKLTSLAGDKVKTVKVSGTKDLKIDGTLTGVTEVDAKDFKGKLDIKLDDQDLKVTGGEGDDTIRTQAGQTLDTKDSFDGGAGTDTLYVANAVATAGPTASITNFEQLGLPDALNGTVDMDKFAGINKVIGDGGIGGDSVFSNVQDDFTFDVKGDLNGKDLKIDHKTDTAADKATLNVDLNKGNQTLDDVEVTDAETFTINVMDTNGDTTKDDLTINNLIGNDLNGATLNLTGDGDVTITAATTPNLSKVEGGTATGDLNIAGLGGQDTAMTINTGTGKDNVMGSTKDDTINTGDGDDTINATAGADNLTGGAGKDTFDYDLATESQGAKVDTITDFVSGTDVIDLFGISGNLNFIGNVINLAAGTAALTAGGANDVFFDVNTSTLVMDANNDGAIDGADLVIQLKNDGKNIASVAEADLGLVGKSITLTAPNAVLSNTVMTNATDVTTPGADTISSTAANLVGSTINGGVGTDTLNVTDPLGAFTFNGNITSVEKIDLKDGSTGLITVTDGAVTDVTNSSTKDSMVNVAAASAAINFTGGSAADALTLGANNHTGKLDGGTGGDTLSVVSSTAIDQAMVAGFEILNIANGSTSIEMTVAQHEAFTAFTGAAGAEEIELFGGGTFTGNASIEDYDASTAGSTNVYDFTVGAAGQSFDGDNGADSIRTNGLTTTGALDGDAGSDTLFTTTGGDVRGSALTSIENLNFTGTVDIKDSQFNAAFLATHVGAGGADTLRIDDDNTALTFTLGATVENLDINNNDGNTVTVAAGAQNANLGTGGDTLNLAGTYTGSLNGEGGADTLIFTANSDVTGATISGFTNETTTLNNNVSLTLDDADFDSFIDGATITATGTNTVTIADTATVVVDGATAERTIENFTLGSAGNDSIEILMDNANTAQNTVNLSGGGNDTVILDNASIEAGEANDFVNINNFTVGGDDLNLQVGNTSHNAGFQTITAAGTNLTVAQNSIVEIQSTVGTAIDLTATGAGAGVETLISAAITNAGTVGTNDFSVILYSGANAGLYNVNVTTDDGTLDPADFGVELVGVVNGVGTDALTSADFV